MNRRTVLAAIGSTLAAGCSQSGVGGAGETGMYRDIGINNTAGTPVEFDLGNNSNQPINIDGEDIPEFDFNSSQLGSDVTFDFGDENNANSDSLPPLTETNNQATEYIIQARQNLTEAIKIYASFGGERIDITSVTPTTESFSQYRIQARIDNISQPLRKAVETATKRQKVYILALEQTAIFLKHATEAEAQLQAAFSEYQSCMSFLYEGDTTNFEAPLRRLQDHTARAQEEIDLIRSETDSTALQVIDASADNLYEAKLAQFSTLIQTFQLLHNAISETGDGLAKLKEGVMYYTNKKYEDALFALITASSDLSSGKYAFEDARSNGVLQSATKPGIDFVTVLYQISIDLKRSSEAKTNDNNEKYVDYREKAIAHLRSDKRTKYMSEISRIQW